MPAEAGIQSVGDINSFKDLDSRFRGNDGVFRITTQPLEGEGVFWGSIRASALKPLMISHEMT
jgi:hypothetical protein